MIVFYFKGMSKVWQRFYFFKRLFKKKNRRTPGSYLFTNMKISWLDCIEVRMKEKGHRPAWVIRPPASHRDQVGGTHPFNPGSHSLPFPSLSSVSLSGTSHHKAARPVPPAYPPAPLPCFPHLTSSLLPLFLLCASSCPPSH